MDVDGDDPNSKKKGVHCVIHSTMMDWRRDVPDDYGLPGAKKRKTNKGEKRALLPMKWFLRACYPSYEEDEEGNPLNDEYRNFAIDEGAGIFDLFAEYYKENPDPKIKIITKTKPITLDEDDDDNSSDEDIYS